MADPKNPFEGLTFVEILEKLAVRTSQFLTRYEAAAQSASERVVAGARAFLAQHEATLQAIGVWVEEQGRWVAEHGPELEAAGLWSSVRTACDKTELYAPLEPDTWRVIAQASRDGGSEDDLRDLVLSSYAPGGSGYQALRAELEAAPLLALKQVEVKDVLTALEQGLNYATICGALPLIEGVLMEAHGVRNKQIVKITPKKKGNTQHPLWKRIYEDDDFTEEERADLILLGYPAFTMIRVAIRDVWKDRPVEPGSKVPELNRNVALHGSGYGWATQEHARYAVLLLAAAVRVAEPLLRPSVPSTP